MIRLLNRPIFCGSTGFSQTVWVTTELHEDLLGYLSDEFEERSMGSHLRSVSPNAPHAGSRSPRRSSKSPRPHKKAVQNEADKKRKKSSPILLKANTAFHLFSLVDVWFACLHGDQLHTPTPVKNVMIAV
ncbi:unnamed protein product [Toxocara canis]|uniref:Uncharacterized protein n=1 Tax=Toxocara canis TaxID=6265 RepID=A0A183TZ86_TOXCA|nr:unnamed protein product [Toxocara canis]